MQSSREFNKLLEGSLSTTQVIDAPATIVIVDIYMRHRH